MIAGIDIGSKTIKIVELEKEGKTFKLKGAGIIGYKGNSIEHMKTDQELAGLSGVLMKLYKEAKISSNEVAIALPESQVFTRVIKFPQLTEQEISSAIKWEAEQYIPIPINEAIIQHQILNQGQTSSIKGVSVLLIAAARTLVERYVKVVQMAKLTPIFVETELMSLTRSLAPKDQAALILDFGARSTDIAIAKNGSLVFSRSIPTGGEALTRAVAQGLGIEQAQAEQYKKTYGFSPAQLEGKIKNALDPVFRAVVDEVKKAIHFYRTEEGGDVPKSAIIAGGTAGLPQMISVLTSALGIEVRIANPFEKINIPEEEKKKVSPYAPLYAISVGLSLRES